MKPPSDAQAALLEFIEGADIPIEWHFNGMDDYRKSRAVLVEEHIDREKNTSQFFLAQHSHRLATLKVCLRNGWLDDLHRRLVTYKPSTFYPEGREWELRQLDLTQDGEIALGLWRERRLNAPPAPLPTLEAADAEVIGLAQRALDRGYALVPLKEVRPEVRRLKKAGWLMGGGPWISHHPHGLVPTAFALTEIDPDRADDPHASDRLGRPEPDSVAARVSRQEGEQ